jgi:hypothetical protein
VSPLHGGPRLIAALLLAVLPRIESVRLTPVDGGVGVRVALSGPAGDVSVSRNGDTTRVSIAGVALGQGFGRGPHVSMIPGGNADAGLLAATPAYLDRIELVSEPGAVGLILHVQPDASTIVCRDEQGLLVLFRTASGAGPACPGAEDDTLALARRLFPSPAPDQASSTGESVAELYSRLFPEGPPQAEPEMANVQATAEEEGLAVGPVRLRAFVDARYVDADAYLTSPTDKVRDRYLEVAPRVAATTRVGDGQAGLEYAPAFRAFATYSEVNRTTQALKGTLDLPLGPSLTVRAADTFTSGVLDTRVADPGGEYFYGLGRFHRNDLAGTAGLRVSPRLSVEVTTSFGRLNFVEPSSFFDYDTRLLSAGLGFELTPNLKATVAYVRDVVPRPPDRPEAESKAQSARLSLSGDLLPLLSGELTLAYRDQKNPNAGPGGRSYSGLTMAVALTEQLARESSISAYVSRSTPPSAYEQNAFYVSTAVQASLQVPLPWSVQLRCGAGRQWNEYRTISSETGAPREDRLLEWFATLRHPIRRDMFLAATFRREQRRSSVQHFDSAGNGFMLSVEWNLFGTSRP